MFFALCSVFDFDGFARAGFLAGAAAHAIIFLDSGDTVNDFDGFNGAFTFAGTATNAFLFVNFSRHGLLQYVFCSLSDCGPCRDTVRQFYNLISLSR